jgi:hypothetical protein
LSPAPSSTAPARRATVEPLAPLRYKVQFTASAELRDKLQRLQALMRASVPDGDLAAVIDAAVTEKLEPETRVGSSHEMPVLADEMPGFLMGCGGARRYFGRSASGERSRSSGTSLSVQRTGRDAGGKQARSLQTW